MGPTSFLSTYVIAMFIYKTVNRRHTGNTNVRINRTDSIICASLLKVKQNHSMPLMLAGKAKWSVKC